MSGENRLVPFSLVSGPEGETRFHLHLLEHSASDEEPCDDENGPGFVNLSPRDVGGFVVVELLRIASIFLGHKQVFSSSSTLISTKSRAQSLPICIKFSHLVRLNRQLSQSLPILMNFKNKRPLRPLRLPD